MYRLFAKLYRGGSLTCLYFKRQLAHPLHCDASYSHTGRVRIIDEYLHSIILRGRFFLCIKQGGRKNRPPVLSWLAIQPFLSVLLVLEGVACAACRADDRLYGICRIESGAGCCAVLSHGQDQAVSPPLPSHSVISSAHFVLSRQA